MSLSRAINAWSLICPSHIAKWIRHERGRLPRLPAASNVADAFAQTPEKVRSRRRRLLGKTIRLRDKEIAEPLSDVITPPAAMAMVRPIRSSAREASLPSS
jgi:hypothetical protein